MGYNLTPTLKSTCKFETAGKRMRDHDVRSRSESFIDTRLLLNPQQKKTSFSFVIITQKSREFRSSSIWISSSSLYLWMPSIQKFLTTSLPLILSPNFPPPYASKTYVKYPPLMEINRSHGMYPSHFFLSEIKNYLILRENPYPNIGESLGCVHKCGRFKSRSAVPP